MERTPTLDEMQVALFAVASMARDFIRDGKWDAEAWAAANAVVDAYAEAHIREGVQE